MSPKLVLNELLTSVMNNPFKGTVFHFYQVCKTATGSSLNIVFFRNFSNIFRTLASLGFPRCQCVYSMAGQTPAIAAELKDFRKITTFKGKTQYLMNTLSALGLLSVQTMYDYLYFFDF